MPGSLRDHLRDILVFLQDVSISPLHCKLVAEPNWEYRLDDAKLYGNTSESQAASYDRDHPLYPYKSHGQWLKASYGLVACIVLILFNGVGAFIEPFSVRKFVSAYISVCSSLYMT